MRTICKERVQRFKETEDSRYTYQNNKACFQFDMAYSILKTYQELFLIKYYMINHLLYYVIKHLILLRIQNVSDINADLPESFTNFLIKGLVVLLSENMSNQQLAEDLQKPIIRKLEKRKVYSSFTDNIWDADLADMQLISKYNKGVIFLLCVIDIYSKYAWVTLL